MTQRFEYRFERLLKVRSSQLEAEKAALQILYRERADIQRSIDILRRSGEQAVRDVLRRPVISGLEMASLSNHRQYVAARLTEADRRMRDCEGRIRRQRERVLQAERSWRLLDRLRERDFEEWKYEANRELEAVAGELYLANWKRP
jgi:flagellar biosynthesis chaperone FliJ